MSNNSIPEMLTLAEASKRTGISYSRLRTWCVQGQIVYIKAGSKFLVNLDRLIDFLNGVNTTSGPEVKEE